MVGLFDSERADMHTSIRRTIEMLNEYGPRFRRWCVAWSGGKDSTAAVTLIAYLIASGKVAAPAGGLEVMFADTRLELPPLWLAAQDIRAELEERGIPVRVVMAPMDRRFMVYILGRGVSPPTHKFRWCTKNIKVLPMKQELERLGASPSDPVLLLTGVRLGESAARDQRIAMVCSTKGGTECGAAQFQGIAGGDGDGPRFYEAPGTNGIATLAPLIHWRICHVWRWLSDWAPEEEFGGWDTRQLAHVYGGRDGDEAQEVGARTGCIGCPLAKTDIALDALLRMDRWSYLRPLKEVRAIYWWLREPGNRVRKETASRISTGDGLATNPQRIGPTTLDARLEGLRRVLDVQQRINTAADAARRPRVYLIDAEEEARIRHLISVGTWPLGWDGTEPVANRLIPGEFFVEDEDGDGNRIRRMEVQTTLF